MGVITYRVGLTGRLRGVELLRGVMLSLVKSRCTYVLVPGVPMFSFGDRCTNLLVPGVPMFSRGDRCTKFFDP